MWGGRFTDKPNQALWEFNQSLKFDKRMADADIRGSIAYAKALCDAGILTIDETETILNGLSEVRTEFLYNTIEYKETDEDIHTAVERRLTEIVGAVGGKLHTGRSRNDQVATDVRLYLMDELKSINRYLVELQLAIIEKAESEIDALMPGYTHLQRAQPVRFSHWLMSYFFPLQRDRERLQDLYKRAAVCPLGSGALAGNSLEIDRDALALELGFASASQNSMDAVSDRDMILETLSWTALLGVHLSRLAEDIIIYATAEFGFIKLDDAYSTGSSLMPQKRNPDSMELARGKSGRLIGNLVGLLATVKGLPSTYNKDLQEDKEPLFDSLDTISGLLPIVSGVVSTMTINAEVMKNALSEDMLAVDLADYLVRKGVPFRSAHHLVGQVIRAAEIAKVNLSKLPIEEYQAVSDHFENDVYDIYNFENSVEQRNVIGGTSKSAVTLQIQNARVCLEINPLEDNNDLD